MKINVTENMPDISRQEFGDRFPLAERYAEILGTKGIEWGLLGPRETERLWSRHLLNCVVLADLIPQGATVADVGSGAGLPGIPLALAREDLRVTCIDSLLRRTRFLSETVADMGLAEQVKVARSRAEELEQTFDIVVARAVAPLSKLIGWTASLLNPSGCLLALKGETAADEIAQAAPTLAKHQMKAELLHLRELPGVEPTNAIRVTRI